MGTVRIPIDDFERGRLPQVCAVTGRPGADIRWNRSVENDAGNLRVLVIFGVVLYIIVRAVTRRTASGNLWLTDEGMDWVKREEKALRKRRSGLAAAAVILFGVSLPAGIVAGSGVVIGVVLLAAVALCVVLLFMPSQVMPAELEASGRWVVFGRIHSDAVRAYEAHVRS